MTAPHPGAHLPIRQHTAQIIDTVRTHPVTVLIGETGSGKTTQLAQILDEAGIVSKGKLIGVTQPRRVAAVMVARRVAQEMGFREVGREVCNIYMYVYVCVCVRARVCVCVCVCVCATRGFSTPDSISFRSATRFVSKSDPHLKHASNF